MKSTASSTIFILFTIASKLSCAFAFAPIQSNVALFDTSLHQDSPKDIDLHAGNAKFSKYDFPQNENSLNFNSFFTPFSVATLASIPLPAEATDQSYQIASALAAYGHYLSLFTIVGALTYERFTIEPGMSKEKEQSLGLADGLFGVSGIALLISGYYRATAYGKGWTFYSHEPIFWLKMVFLCIFGAASLFPTVTIIKRTVAIQTGESLEPMSEKLASRLKSVINAEILMLASIPLTATLMARGVLYTEAIPFQYIGPAACAVTASGLGYKYVKEALNWTED